MPAPICRLCSTGIRKAVRGEAYLLQPLHRTTAINSSQEVDCYKRSLLPKWLLLRDSPHPSPVTIYFAFCTLPYFCFCFSLVFFNLTEWTYVSGYRR